MKTMTITTEYIKLQDLLKLANVLSRHILKGRE